MNVGKFITLNALNGIFCVTERQYDVQALHNNVLQQLLGENAPKKDAVDSFLEAVEVNSYPIDEQDHC